MPHAIPRIALLAACWLVAACSGKTSDTTPAGADGVTTTAGFAASDTDALETYCAASTSCAVGTGQGSDFGVCVYALASEAVARGGRLAGDERVLLVGCARATPGNCDAIQRCYRGATEARAVCQSNPYRTLCEGDHLVACGYGATGPGGSVPQGQARITDCAAAWAAGKAVGGPRCIDPNPDGGGYGTAACGVEACDPQASGWTCKGDVMLTCQSGVLRQEDCGAEGLACPAAQSYYYGGAQCSARRGCDGGASAFGCDLTRAVERCGDAVVASTSCTSRPDWTCISYDPSSGTSGCYPVVVDCDPRYPSSTCEGDVLRYCRDGRYVAVECSLAGFARCSDSYASGVALARCVP